MTAALAAISVRKTFMQGEREIQALRGVDLQVEGGEFVTITGASGSGKSTLLHVLGALDRPDEGRVEVEGRSLETMSDEDLAVLRRRRLGFVLQFFNLLPTLSALENAAFPLLLDGHADALERAAVELGRVGLWERAEQRPGRLSGGEQQRVALARALVARPAVVLADEPTGNLDSKTGRSVLEFLRSVADDGQTIVMVTHDRDSAAFADRVLELSDGLLREAK